MVAGPAEKLKKTLLNRAVIHRVEFPKILDRSVFKKSRVLTPYIEPTRTGDCKHVTSSSEGSHLVVILKNHAHSQG